MAEIVISVENLSKKYRIRHAQRERYTALRDAIGHKFAAPFRALFGSNGFWTAGGSPALFGVPPKGPTLPLLLRLRQGQRKQEMQGREFHLRSFGFARNRGSSSKISTGLTRRCLGTKLSNGYNSSGPP